MLSLKLIIFKDKEELKKLLFMKLEEFILFPNKTYMEIKMEIPALKGIAFNRDRDSGVKIIREMVFYRIIGFKESYERGDYAKAKELLLRVAGSRENIMRAASLRNSPLNKWYDTVFGRESIQGRSAEYWDGSYVKALMDSFPELNLNLFDFKKLPRNAEKIFDEKFAKRHSCAHGSDFIIEQAREKYPALKKFSDEEVIIVITNLLAKARFPKAIENVRHISQDYIFSQKRIRWAKSHVIHLHGSVEIFSSEMTKLLGIRVH